MGKEIGKGEGRRLPSLLLSFNSISPPFYPRMSGREGGRQGLKTGRAGGRHDQRERYPLLYLSGIADDIPSGGGGGQKGGGEEGK